MSLQTLTALILIGFIYSSTSLKCYYDSSMSKEHSRANQLVPCGQEIEYCAVMRYSYMDSTAWDCDNSNNNVVACKAEGNSTIDVGDGKFQYLYCCKTDGCNDIYASPTQVPPPSTTPGDKGTSSLGTTIAIVFSLLCSLF